MGLWFLVVLTGTQWSGVIVEALPITQVSPMPPSDLASSGRGAVRILFLKLFPQLKERKRGQGRPQRIVPEPSCSQNLLIIFYTLVIV
jgi:hypothetical protein